MSSGVDMRAATATATYVYGVMRDARRIRRAGIAEAEVRTVAHGELVALVSMVESDHLRAKRRDLVAHQEVLQEAFGNGPVLPVRFGTVFADDEAVVSELLAPKHDALSSLLDRLADAVEVTVRAHYVEDALLREIVAEDDRVARLKGTRGAEVALGEAVAKALSRKRAAEAGTIERLLVRHARDAVIEQPRTELELFRGSFLVDRNTLEAMDDAMDELAREREGVVVFKYVGPLPPHSFVDMGAL